MCVARSGSGCGTRRRRGGSATATAAPAPTRGTPLGVRLGAVDVVCPSTWPVLGVLDSVGLVRVRVHQPPGPAGDVDDERDPTRWTNAGSAVDQRRSAATGLPHAEGPRGRRRPRPDQQSERRQRVQRGPTWCRWPARSTPRRPAARAATAARAPGPSRAGRAGAGRHSRAIRAAPVPVGDQAGTAQSMKNARKMSSSASRESTKCRPSKHSSSPAMRAEQRRAGQPPGQPDITSTISEPTTARRSASRTGPSRTAARRARSATCRPPGARPSRRLWSTCRATWPARILALASSTYSRA